MVLLFSDSFEGYGEYTMSVPIQRTWWQRLLGRKPAGTAYVNFQVQFDDTGWRWAEAVADYPEGIDEIRLTVECKLDGDPVYFGHHPVLGTRP